MEVKTFIYPNMVIRVHIPELSQEEREKRMNALHKQAERFLIAREERA